ncbi:MAG: hypothetical protein IRY99_28035, partial [Isosphaeraceae bacterium]|nr:hypothetical protein [Isosphaeraceae bacterium]
AWSPDKPQTLTCRRCGVNVPNAQYPAKVEGKILEEVVEVLPRILHKYPYHSVPPEKQDYPDERIYLAAKRDYEAREFLAKAALYAALRAKKHRQESGPKDRQESGPKDDPYARMAAVLVLRFAQVYPAYAVRYDQPGQPKYFQRADQPPPYRRGYRSGKWDWLGCLDVPLNLVLAYACLRGSPAVAEAGAALGDPHPARTIEHDLFRASAAFVRNQPEEFGEASLLADRGLLAVGRLLNDPALVHEAVFRLEGFAERGFYHDGLWHQGDASAHRRVLGLIDTWIERLLAGYTDPPGYTPPGGGRRFEALPGAGAIPMLALARRAGAVVLTDPRLPEVQQASWPAPPAPPSL